VIRHRPRVPVWTVCFNLEELATWTTGSCKREIRTDRHELAVPGHLSQQIEQHEHLDWLRSDSLALLEPGVCCLGEHSHPTLGALGVRPAKAVHAGDSLFASPTTYGGCDAVCAVSQSAGLRSLQTESADQKKAALLCYSPKDPKRAQLRPSGLARKHRTNAELHTITAGFMCSHALTMNRFALYSMNRELVLTISRTKALRLQLELTDWRSLHSLYAQATGWRQTQAKQELQEERLAQAIKSAASADLTGLVLAQRTGSPSTRGEHAR
jgi:hypothetical protein